jgi:hypothetical protein
MKPANDDCHEYEFYFPEVDVHVRVESNSDEVLLRASSRNFSEKRKIFFIRHLAAEGFIPSRFGWFAECYETGFSGIRWIVDTSWLKIHPAVTRRASKFMRALLLDVGLIWLAALGFVIFNAP